MELWGGRHLVVLVLVVLMAGCAGGGGQLSPYTVTGQVVNYSGDGVPGVNLEASGRGAVTDENGYYEFQDLRGQVTIRVEEQDGTLVVPRWRMANSAGNVDSFVIHDTQELGADSEIPLSNVVAFEGGLAEFANSDLAAGTTFMVAPGVANPGPSMELIGPVLDFQLSQQFSGTVDVYFQVDDPADAGVFRFGEIDQEWSYVPSTYDGGYFVVRLDSFSTYGVFSAPRSESPSAQPAPGSVMPGTEVHLTGGRIHYTTDGTVPTHQSPVYDSENPPRVGESGLILKAFASNPHRIDSEVIDFTYSISDDMTFVATPHHVILEGLGTWFDFDSGQVVDVNSDARDVQLTGAIYGSDYVSVGWRDFSGTWFRPDPQHTDDPVYEYSCFRTVTAADWRADDPYESGNISKYDTFLLRTSGGRMVKVFILDVRTQWQHDDAPAVEFIYYFTDEIDLEPPTLTAITLVTVDGEETTLPLTEVVEFTVSSEPEYLQFEFNEVAYRHRNLWRIHGDGGFGREYAMWFYAHPYYYNRPSEAQQFSATLNYFEQGGNTIRITEATSYDHDDDRGYFFSDIAGNSWTELPFSEIVITYLPEL